MPLRVFSDKSGESICKNFRNTENVTLIKVNKRAMQLCQDIGLKRLRVFIQKKKVPNLKRNSL